MCAYNPGVQFDASPIFRGLAGGAADLASAMVAKKEKDDADKDFQARARSTESFIKSHASDLGWSGDDVKQMLNQGLDESPRAHYLRLTDTLGNAITGVTLKAKLAEAKQNQEQAVLQANINNAHLAQMSRASKQADTNADALKRAMAATAAGEDGVGLYADLGGNDAQEMSILATRMKPGKPMAGSQGVAVEDIPGMGKLARDRATGEVIDSSKLSAPKEAAPKTPTEAQVTFDSNLEVAMKKLDEFEKLVNEYGNFETGVGNPAANAALSQLPYQLAVLTAKIVDPATAAREGEVASAQKYILPAGFFTNNSTTTAAIRNLRETFKQYGAARSAAQGKSGGVAEASPAGRLALAGITPVNSQAEYDALPRGAKFSFNGRFGTKR